MHIDENGEYLPEDFKIVYVAPMKALAAEVTDAFSRRLAPLDIVVAELTGDTQLSKRELEETHMIVTTPEKWDVITRKGGEVSVASTLRLLIIDEVHLLNDERGPVIETLVARTLRQVEQTQSMIRIVGLSATLPNPVDVAKFLGVNNDSGLFVFDQSYRPIPLTQRFIGVTEKNSIKRQTLMTQIAYDKACEALRNGKQAMVFVHSRKDTVKTARQLAEFAAAQDGMDLFSNDQHERKSEFAPQVARSRNNELKELFLKGLGCHNAGMLRADRSLTEKLFAAGVIKVLVCTATLAWGVNLPAHMVVIKGTQLYDPQRGGFRNLGVLDVQQIFGRAGRPGFDTSGEGVIVTEHKNLAHYVAMLTSSTPIESQFVSNLADNLNAEVTLGTVTNVREGAQWLGYSYLHTRMEKNPLAYGLTWDDIRLDPGLLDHRRKLIKEAARTLDRAKDDSIR
jgi:activating signal cointegrator complex subunit 3